MLLLANRQILKREISHPDLVQSTDLKFFAMELKMEMSKTMFCSNPLHLISMNIAPHCISDEVGK